MKLFHPLVFIIAIGCIPAVYGQKKNVNRCGFFSKSLVELKENFNHLSANLGVKPGELIASVGSSNGIIEIQTSSFIDSLQWTLQDINTECLNRQEVDNMIQHHENLIGRKINATFELVVGEVDKTNLPRDTFDKILLINVYHELSHKTEILKDIYGSLKPSGALVIMERMGKKPGEKHGDCGLQRLIEEDLIMDMKAASFELLFKKNPDKKLFVTFYTFKRI